MQVDVLKYELTPVESYIVYLQSDLFEKYTAKQNRLTTNTLAWCYVGKWCEQSHRTKGMGMCTCVPFGKEMYPVHQWEMQGCGRVSM